MRIFVAIRHALDPLRYYSQLWTNNFYPALIQLGHDVIESKVDLLPASQFMHISGQFTREEIEVRATITEKLLKEIRQEHQLRPIDIVLTYFYNAHFDPSGLDEIHRMNIVTINFFCNSIYQFDLVKDIAARANYSWYPERNARQKYVSIGANPVRVQMGADPLVYNPMFDISREMKACFVGQRYADRDRWVAALIQASIPLAVYGSGWNESNPSGELTTFLSGTATSYLGRSIHKPGSIASYLEVPKRNVSLHGAKHGLFRTWHQAQYKAETDRLRPLFIAVAQGKANSLRETFAAYEVVLNFSNVWADGSPGSPLIPHVRLRDFEAPMCRCCYLTGHTEELMEFYEIGEEIDTYSTSEELVDKIRFYLKYPDRAEALREGGYRRAIRSHTWVHRFEQLFQLIGWGI